MMEEIIKKLVQKTEAKQKQIATIRDQLRTAISEAETVADDLELADHEIECGLESLNRAVDKLSELQ